MDLMENLVKERFGTDAAHELCRVPGLFEPGKLYRRVQISETLLTEFVRRGGVDTTRKEQVANVLKKWLRGPSSPFRKERRGLYWFVGFDGQSEQELELGDRDIEGDDPANDEGLTPGRELGEGPCEVYAWCLPQYQETSGDRWPIKIGKAGPDGLRRRFRDFEENLPERPRYLLRLGCADDREAKDRESLLHAWFRSRGQKLDHLPGEEWFLTNPSEIEKAIQNIIRADDPNDDGGAPRVEDEIAAAFKDVTAEDWARFPEDLTDRLDDYLYGDEST